jgi:hypothetical protein
MLDDVRCDFRRERQWESHASVVVTNGAILPVGKGVSTATLPPRAYRLERLGMEKWMMRRARDEIEKS